MKVRFEIEVENTGILDILPPSNDDIFIGATGKNFLYKDPLTGYLTIIACNRGRDEEHNFAGIFSIPLPVSAKIIDNDEYEQDIEGRIYSLLVDGLQSLRSEIKGACEEILNAIDQKGIVVTEGISENTLLEALRIVTKKEDQP